jgi:hypothetical protein
MSVVGQLVSLAATGAIYKIRVKTQEKTAIIFDYFHFP